jgi:hypothetical protein
MGTARYTVQIGKEKIAFEGPDDLSQAEIEQLADQQLKTARPGQTFSHARYAGQETPVKNSSSGIGSYLRGALHGGYWNFDDEIAAAGNAAIPGMAALENATGGDAVSMYGDKSKGFWDAFNRNMSASADQKAADVAKHPSASFWGNLTGAASTIIPAAEATAARIPLAAKGFLEAHPFLSAAGTGGLTGAVSGAGEGRGAQREQNAALGLMTGTALGAGMSGLVKAAPAVANYVKLLFNKGQAATQTALGQLTKALERDGFDIAHPQFGQLVRDAVQQFTGKPVSLADIGTATRARAGVALRTPNSQQAPAIDAISQRAAGAGQRLASDVRATVAPRTDVHALDEELVAQRDAEAKTLRDRALFEQGADPAAAITAPGAGVERTIARDVVPTDKNPIIAGGRQSRIVLDPELQQLARLPLAMRALPKALEQAGAERDLLAVTGKDFSHLPDLTRSSDLDMRSFDYLKRYLDDEVSRLYRGSDTSTFKAAELQQVKALRDTIRQRLRDVVPEYADYLDAYKGSSEMIDSLREGQDFSKLAPEQIVSQQAGRSDAGRELYRVGAARSLLDDIRTARDTGQNPAYRIANSDEARSQIGAVVADPKQAAQLNRAVGQERTLNLLNQELKGSQTQQRQLAQADADAVSDLNLPLNPFSKISLAGAILRAPIRKFNLRGNADVNAALLPRITSTDPQVIEQTIQELERHGQWRKAAELRRNFRTMRSSAVAGNIIGSPISFTEEQ